jgi:hypothetical protein
MNTVPTGYYYSQMAELCHSFEEFINPLKPSGNYKCHLGGVVVSVLAARPNGSGFKTRSRRWIFKGDKNPQHTFPSDGK